MDVVTLRWPLEEGRRQTLAASGIPRLLVVDGEHEPPRIDDPYEDWIRIPALEIDRVARIDGLRRRLGDNGRRSAPEIDENGLVRCGDTWVSVPPIEAALCRALLERFGAVVSRTELETVAWPDGGAQRNALDVRILRLRRRIADLGLAIRTIRSRGYLLEWEG